MYEPSDETNDHQYDTQRDLLVLDQLGLGLTTDRSDNNNNSDQNQTNPNNESDQTPATSTSSTAPDTATIDSTVQNSGTDSWDNWYREEAWAPTR